MPCGTPALPSVTRPPAAALLYHESLACLERRHHYVHGALEVAGPPPGWFGGNEGGRLLACLECLYGQRAQVTDQEIHASVSLTNPHRTPRGELFWHRSARDPHHRHRAQGNWFSTRGEKVAVRAVACLPGTTAWQRVQAPHLVIRASAFNCPRHTLCGVLVGTGRDETPTTTTALEVTGSLPEIFGGSESDHLLAWNNAYQATRVRAMREAIRASVFHHPHCMLYGALLDTDPDGTPTTATTLEVAGSLPGGKSVINVKRSEISYLPPSERILSEEAPRSRQKWQRCRLYQPLCCYEK